MIMEFFKRFYFIVLLAPLVLFSCTEDEEGEVDPEEEAIVVDSVGVGLVTHFKLDGNADDATAGQFDATLIGEDASEVEGVEGSALFFNKEEGGDNGCGMPGGSHIRLPTYGAIWEEGFSVAAWVQFTEVRNYERIVDLANGRGEDGGTNVTFSRLKETNDLALTSWINEDPYTNRTDGRLVAPEAIKNGEMQFLVGTIDKNGAMAIYSNGVKIAEKEDGQPVVNVVRTSNYIAHSNYCEDDPDFRGIMDDVKIFNYALSAEEVEEMYGRLK